MFKVVRGFLKIRYLFLGSAVGGGVGLTRKYEEFKANLPEMPSFIKDMFNKMPIESFDIDSWSATLSRLSHDQLDTFNQWLDEASDVIKSSKQDRPKPELPKDWNITKRSVIDASNIIPSDKEEEEDKTTRRQSLAKLVTSKLKAVGNSRDRYEQLEEEMRRKSEESSKKGEELINIRREMERIRKENRELRSVVRGGGSLNANQVKRKLKKSLIEIYSEVLDELSGYDSSYKMQDHLPKVVVVGDQSSGKTSVLEMIAGARIFPRGAGEMMTRAPVQVTLSEGPYHIAHFKDSSREFDLTKESELAELRQEIEDRMRKSVQGGKTVSSQVISLTIQGPGIQRMVLVDLPGVIGTVTSELAPDTRDCIRGMVTEYMGNPNAIILCIQDGSIDAERSIFTDLVREVDKKGKRTILVLTKVDIAEKTHTNPSKIKKILDGELFPMKALGYYAVVAGKSGENENIQEIQDYEEQFFLTSSLCEKGILNPSQCTTRNLSAKVSECFWGMVKASIEQQADAYRATLYNLEAEWNHLFPHMRQLSRDELFFNARNEILNEVAKLSRLSTKHWDQFISTQLWERVRNYILEKIYFPAAKDPLHFSAKVDIELQRWVDSLELPKLAVKVAQDSVRFQFDNLLDAKNCSRETKCTEDDDGEVYQELKRAVIHDALERHEWKSKAFDILKVVQLEALSKQISLTKDNWTKAINFLQESLSNSVELANNELIGLTGNSLLHRWTHWKTTTPEQKRNQAIEAELKKLLHSNDSSSSSQMLQLKLTEPDIITVKKNLESQGIEVDSNAILQVWDPLFKHAFLKNEVDRAQECGKVFYFYENDLDSGTDCSHVLFFWRIKRMLEFTANSLRRQILEDECRRIEKEIIEVLDDYSEDSSKKLKHLHGKRVELAEELKRVRQIQEKLDEFITALNQDGGN